jgi:hypothetical protein
MMIVNDDSRVVNKLVAWLTDDARVIIYDHHMFIVQATGFSYRSKKFYGTGPSLGSHPNPLTPMLLFPGSATKYIQPNKVTETFL